MAKRTVTFSLDEKIIEMISFIVDEKIEIENKSHLIATLVIKENAKVLKDKQNV